MDRIYIVENYGNELLSAFATLEEARKFVINRYFECYINEIFDFPTPIETIIDDLTSLQKDNRIEECYCIHELVIGE